jgi:hypothetical protein
MIEQLRCISSACLSCNGYRSNYCPQWGIIFGGLQYVIALTVYVEGSASHTQPLLYCSDICNMDHFQSTALLSTWQASLTKHSPLPPCYIHPCPTMICPTQTTILRTQEAISSLESAVVSIQSFVPLYH